MPSRDARNDGKKNAIVLIDKDVRGMDQMNGVHKDASSMYVR
jgi:hypothetical protein